MEDIILALNEAATNAVLHGSGGGRPVEVAVRVRGGWAEASVLDRGPVPRTGDSHDRGNEIEAASHGGRGLWLLGRLVDEVWLERVELGTRVTLRRRLDVGPTPTGQRG